MAEIVILEQMAEQVEQTGRIGLPGSTERNDQGAGDTQTPPETAPESDDEIVARLVALPPLQYDRERTKAAKAMGVRPATLDAIVKAARGDGDKAERLPFATVEAWHEPIHPALLLAELADTIRRFIVLDREQADAAALWVAFTHFVDVVEVAPLAIINAPEKACGKSQLLSVFGRMACRPLPAANSSAAFLFRAVEQWIPTVLIDEADTFIRDNEELKGLVNAGHTRANAFVGRVVGEDLQPKLFNVWGAKALAGIALEKHLPDATMSRAIVFNMRRKLQDEKVARLRHAEAGMFDRLSAMLARFADDYAEEVRAARPALPDALSDREQDNWEPLLAIAGCAGPEWIARATHAALKLSGAANAAQSAANELLADIQHVFESRRADRIKTADLIAALVEDDEAAWATWNKGRPLTPRQLGRMLSGYGIRSKDIRNGYEVAKGFTLEQFSDAFARYLSAPPDLPATSATTAANPINTGRDVSRMNQQRSGSETVPATPKPAPVLDCSAVADKTGVAGEGGKGALDGEL